MPKEQESVDAWTQRIGVREGVFWVLLTGILLWTAYIFADGCLIQRAVNTDAPPVTVWRLLSPTMLISPEQFGAIWLDPAQRSAFITNFLATFWKTRIEEWAEVTVGVGMIALLIRP